MKKVTKTFIAAVATLALSSSYAMAQSASEPSQTGSGATMSTESGSTTMDTGTGQATGGSTMGSDTDQQVGASQAQSAEELKGMKVVSQNGEEIGDIKEVRIDEQSGEVKFVTLSRGGVLGIGGEEIAVPLEALQFDNEEDRATLTVSEDKLDTAPQQANMSDEDFQRDLESHYGISPTWQQDTTDPSRSMDQPPSSDMQSPGAQDPTLDPQSGTSSQETQGTMEPQENRPAN